MKHVITTTHTPASNKQVMSILGVDTMDTFVWYPTHIEITSMGDITTVHKYAPSGRTTLAAFVAQVHALHPTISIKDMITGYKAPRLV